MRSHMYAVQYANDALAAETMADVRSGTGLSACMSCNDCRAKCRNSVNIAKKIRRLKEIAAMGRLSA